MLRSIVRFSLVKPLFVALATLLLIGGGLLAFKNLPIEAFPDVSDIQVTVITLYPGHAAEEVEKQVTIPIELALSGVPNAVRVFSHTQFGLSFMIVTFNDKATDYFARAQVMERLQTADLPDGVKPELAALTSAISEIYRYRLRGDNLSAVDLRTLQNWVMERQLKTVPGVADVVSFGGGIKTYEVQPDLGRLRDTKISIEQLATALGKSNANTGGGYVEHGQQQYLIRGLGLLRGPEDIENITVASRNGTPIKVSDIAKVVVSELPRQGVAGQNENDDVVFGIVLMRKGENASVVLDAVKEKLDDIRATSLPAGVTIEPFYDRSWLIDRTMHTVFSNLVEGAMLVCFVLFLFLGNFRAAAIVAAVIPLSLLGTFIGLTIVGIPANLLSLGAMDFGIIVDGAVIVVENVFHRLSTYQGKLEGRNRVHEIIDAAAEVGRPTLFSMIIIISAHIPIFTLQRHEGRIFSPMAWTVTSALVTSLIISLTLVPLLLHLLLKKNLPHGDVKLVQKIKGWYEPLLDKALNNSRKVFIAAIAALVASFAVVPMLGSEFLPELNEGSIWLNVTLHPSSSITEAQSMAHRIRAAVLAVPEVKTITSKLGRPEDGTDPKIASQIEALIELKPESEWRAGKKKRDLLDEMERNIETIPGVGASFGQPIRDNVLESISQIVGQIIIKVTGDDLDKLQDIGNKILEDVRPVAGVDRAVIDRNGQLPQYRIDIDRNRAARYGLSVGDIEDVIETAIGGKDTTYIWEGERRFSIVLRLAEADRALDQLRRVPIVTPDGAFIPLHEVADFSMTNGAMNIARENGSRVLSVAIFIKDRDMGSVVADMKKATANIALPEGYRISWSGEFENQERAMKRLSWVVPLSILLIYILLVNAFGSLRSATLIIVNIPFAMIGGIFALLITGIPLSVSAAIGFIALFGQAVLNGVVMISHFNQLVASGMPARMAALQGSLNRLRTVLMTAMLAMLGLFPMALSTAIGSETQKPLAIVVIGGLVTATLLTLFVLPTLYVWAMEKTQHRYPQNEA
ncbi:MAG TPA: CusA/CzcA family heavy metal efflux RND transporter [Rhodocyclaceae bacterium]|jgi:cobalt-zinc-cadmium resistance protein CzcA|nr:CusA/CzcA family heavy metal efflux RND transporter [Rhodocyclaceae bacterium]